jgi:gliding motility-associated lipoprotein GldH
MSKATKVFFFLALLATLSCTENRYFEANQDFPDRVWTMNNNIDFTFTVDDPEALYQLYINIRNDVDYPYRNLYIHYSLVDSLDNILDKKLQDIQLFEAKTGAPYGENVSNIYSHQILLEDSVAFPSKGQFTITYKQYMRTDSLKGIYSAGLRIEKMVNSVE